MIRFLRQSSISGWATSALCIYFHPSRTLRDVWTDFSGIVLSSGRFSSRGLWHVLFLLIWKGLQKNRPFISVCIQRNKFSGTCNLRSSCPLKWKVVRGEEERWGDGDYRFVSSRRYLTKSVSQLRFYLWLIRVEVCTDSHSFCLICSVKRHVQEVRESHFLFSVHILKEQGIKICIRSWVVDFFISSYRHNGCSKWKPG